MDTTQIYQAINAVSQKVNDVNSRLDQMTQFLDAQRKEEIEAITPYIQTKTAYIGDTEVTFLNTPSGNLTVYFPYEYTVERLTDRIVISFNELQEVTDVTISIL